MKIIGTTKDGFLLTANKNELKKLADCYYERKRSIEIEVGQEIPISDMYDQIRFLTEHKNTIEQAKEKLMKVVENLEMIKPFVEA